MGSRVRGVAVVAVVLAVGTFLGSAVSQWSRPAVSSEAHAPEVEDPSGLAPAGVRVRVEVLNGGGREGMAWAATEHLRDREFDVVYYGNAGSFDHDSSVVIDRVDRPELARAVAEALDIRTVRIEPDSNLYLDVSVVLGAEWEPREAPAGPAAGGDGEPSSAWWDLRRLFERDENLDSLPRGRLANPGEEGNDD